jgi:hypothetical protein
MELINLLENLRRSTAIDLLDVSLIDAMFLSFRKPLDSDRSSALQLFSFYSCYNLVTSVFLSSSLSCYYIFFIISHLGLRTGKSKPIISLNILQCVCNIMSCPSFIFLHQSKEHSKREEEEEKASILE